ncbi:hypothetical protein [Pseudomonas taiwanensis]|uniref:hypothetical protein n=1 Tax=Pseudomonas taiwanensis TaxID=470150 RepID=UPI0016459369|nr:hypothetical protein [Pseudomonas taiwanensis]MBC3489393.1 hypothetical protein [Pseudomonas taiwanensis]
MNKQASKHYSARSVIAASLFLTISACTLPARDNSDEIHNTSETLRLKEAYDRLTFEHPEFNWKYVEGLAE